MKNVVYIPFFPHVTPNDTHFRNVASSQNFCEEPMFVFLTVQKDYKSPNKMIDYNEKQYGLL